MREFKIKDTSLVKRLHFENQLLKGYRKRLNFHLTNLTNKNLQEKKHILDLFDNMMEKVDGVFVVDPKKIFSLRVDDFVKIADNDRLSMLF